MRILVAEDDPDVARLLDVVFSGFGHQVTVVADGREAITELQARNFDVAVLDVMMPQVDGFEVVRFVRRDPKLRELPLVMLTAKGNEESHVQGFTAGADAYVTKPFRPVELHETVLEVAAASPDERRVEREAERSRAEFLRKLEHRF